MIPNDVRAILGSARRIAVLSGAGISAESGIPTFRDALTGLWAHFDPEELGTPEAFVRDPALVWGWYEWRRAQVMRVRPNAGHVAVARLASVRSAVTVITQNVDDLHERAGSRDVIHLHGSLAAPRCFDCGAPHRLPDVMPDEPEGGRKLAPPLCMQCAGLVRPGVVWFGEALPDHALRHAIEAVQSSDLVLVVGTSGLVQPAASLPARARAAGATVIQVNPAASALDRVCHWNLRGSGAELLLAIVDAISETLPPAL